MPNNLMKPGSKITVITVCYNAAASIEATLKNVAALFSSQLDYIVVDGGSTDGTIAIIKHYEDTITYWNSEPDKGIYDAMNKGWERADINSHILFLGSGDTILNIPGDYDLKNDCIYYGDVIIGVNKIFTSKVDFRLKIGNTVHHQALLIPKMLHPSPPFNVGYKIYGDFDFNQRLLKSKVKFIKTDIRSYVMPGGISQHYKTMEWYDIIKINFGRLYAGLGYLYYKFQKIREKRR